MRRRDEWRRARRASECRTLPDGTTVQLVSMPYGFSDDNEDGSAAAVDASAGPTGS